MGSWERDTGALSALTDRAENRKRKIFPFFFSQPILLSFEEASIGFSNSIWFTNTNSTHTYLCLLSAALRQGIRSRRQEYWFSVRKRLLLKGISHDSPKPFSLTA